MELLYSFPFLILIAVIVFGFKSFIVVPQQEAYIVDGWGVSTKSSTPA